ncbi:MAG: iron ABC transporter permease [Prevotella sp.]|nr:iron ABC transporter permease [Prevotella sp.]
MVKCRKVVSLSILIVGIGVLFALNLIFGSVSIPLPDIWNILFEGDTQNGVWRFIVLESRLPQAMTSLLAGAALSVSGLMLQTAFRNPLAGPDVFGISSGAGLGVALVILAMGGSVSTSAFSVSGSVAVLGAAFAGAMVVMGLIFLFSTTVRNNVMLLIVGIMIGYLMSSAITLLNFAATEEGVRSYMVWGLGNFGGVSMEHMPLFASLTSLGLVGALLLIKPLNAMLMGEQYAESLGVDTKAVRNMLLLITGLLTAIVTAYCGPVAFIGLVVPHMARLLLGTENHRSLLPTTILMGGAMGVFCNLICNLPVFSGIIPLNAVTPLVGAPVIIYVIARHRQVDM